MSMDAVRVEPKVTDNRPIHAYPATSPEALEVECECSNNNNSVMSAVSEGLVKGRKQ